MTLVRRIFAAPSLLAARGIAAALAGCDTVGVELSVRDAAGGPIPCKVQFRGRGCPDPDFAPDSADTAVRNLVYSADGRFRQEIAPGTYDVLVSYGPEYDVVITEVTVARDAEARLAARLVRSVDTKGWISSDFHSHATPSGDNTCSQLGRVQNLLCEHIEFAPARRAIGFRPDTDGTPDAGFEPMLGFVDVIEVHPLKEIFAPSAIDGDPRKRTHTVFRWLQMLNLGYRIPGVVNTDAHYAFHGSGWLRNYVASPTDDPAEIRVDDVVKASGAGRLVMTSGPFLEVTAQADGAGEAGPGESLAAADGRVELRVRVQCPNWFDVDRVQVFVNGRPEPALDFTRRDHGELYSRDAVRFEHTIPIRLETDAHLVVATVGEGSGLGVVMGPDNAEKKPIAVANPIFVDVDGGGFRANGDLLGVPLPHQKEPTGQHHHHDHDHDDHGHAVDEPTGVSGAR